MKKNNENTIATIENTTNAITTTNNSEKTNKILSLDDVTKLFIECNVKPKFTDHKLYVGCGTKSNTFSVNAKKTKYNIYCDDDNYTLISALNFNNTKCIKNGNSTDTTRPHYIECTSTAVLKKMLQIVLKNNDKIALVK